MPKENSQKQAVAKYFSENRLVWKDIYNEDNHSMNLCFQISRRKQAILHFVDELARGRTLGILDVGAGAGILLRDLLERGHQTMAIDISFEMVQTARETVAEGMVKKKDCVQADVEALPFGEERFDVVTCLGVLSFVPSENRAIGEMGRVLKPGGVLIVTLPNILRVNNFLDPYFYIEAGRLVKRKLFAGKRKRQDGSVRVGNQAFDTRKYFYNQLKPLFAAHNLSEIKTVALGFGPLTYFKKQILTGRSFLLISGSLEKMAGLKIFRFLNFFTNHWVVYLKRT